jgi:hypothetical protein
LFAYAFGDDALKEVALEAMHEDLSINKELAASMLLTTRGGMGGEFSEYNYSGGLKGLETNVTGPEFISNLRANGYTATESVGKNGPVTVLQNGNGSTWTVYTRSSTHDVGAEYWGPDGQHLKYNLGR